MRRLFRLSLRTTFVIVTALCILLALKAKQIRDQKQAVDAIIAAGGRIHYDDQLDPDSLAPINASWTRRWLIKHVGSEYVAKVSLVTLYPTAQSAADEQVKMLTGLPYLRNLAIWPGGNNGKASLDTDAPGGLSNDGLLWIAARLPNLRHLSVSGSTVTTDGLECLEQSRKLESLQVSGFKGKSLADVAAFAKRSPQIKQ